MSAYDRYKRQAASFERQRQERNEADAHWHSDSWVYWTQQNVPPADQRWMAAWLSTHDRVPAGARNPKEQRERRVDELKDAFYDAARKAALRRVA